MYIIKEYSAPRNHIYTYKQNEAMISKIFQACLCLHLICGYSCLVDLPRVALIYLTWPLVAPPCLWSHSAIFLSTAASIRATGTEAHLDRFQCRKNSSQVHQAHRESITSDNDIHSISTGPSAAEGARHRHQPARSEVLKAGLWDPAPGVSEERMLVWGQLLSSWEQITGIQRTGTILIQDQGCCLEKTNSKKYSYFFLTWH